MWQVEGPRAKYNDGSWIVFEYPIKELTEILDIAVVVLDLPNGAVMTENVFGISRDGVRLWQIEWIPQTGTNPRNCYVGVVRTDLAARTAHIANGNGDVVETDVRTGKVLSSEFLK
jgi:hypothetical protein